MNEIAAPVAATLSAGTPLLLAAIGIVVSEKSGVVNLGIEGMMLVAAVTGFGAAHASGIPEVGFLAGATAGIMLALLFAVLTLGLLTNQYATGLALALFGAGLSAFVGQALQGESLAPRSGGGNQIHVETHTNLAAEHVEQNGDTVVVSDSVEQTGAIHECAPKHPHPCAERENRFGFHPDKAPLVLACLQRAQHAIGHHSRIFAVADETRNALR